MSNIGTFITPSPLHQVEKENMGFTIKPISDDSISLEQFQSIARAAVAYSGHDYTTQAHYDGHLIDSVYFIPLSSN